LRLPNLIDLEGQTVHLECPWCGLPYSLLNGIYGQFYGCLQFKQCGGGTGVGLAQMSRLRNGLGDSVVDHGVESKAEDDINLSPLSPLSKISTVPITPSKTECLVVTPDVEAHIVYFLIYSFGQLNSLTHLGSC
jgi:hypothetical protein